MKCPRCQAENPAEMKFCGQCAASLALVCSSCGATNPPENKFCGQCATSLRKPADPPFAAPESYTPKHLAEKILISRSALEGERKQVTVLFADLKGSMELLADRDPEEARKLLDAVLERMMEAVHRYEGTVNQVMGDGIMALFGAPLAHEDHAVRACVAALRMQERVSLYGDELQRNSGLPVQIRVGLNSGEVVVRAIGSDLRMDYSAVGQTTHLAARMEQIAKPGTTLLTAHTLRLAEGRMRVRPLGPVSVKGLDQPVEVYELTGATAARSRLEAAATRGLSRFVGRRGEMEQLLRIFEQARTGRGQVFALVGDPGVGKSRLFYEFTRSHHTGDCLVLESASVSYGKATPYLPLVVLLKSYFRIEDRDDTRTVGERVTGRLLALDRTLEDSLPAVLALLDALPEADPFHALDPPRRRQETLGALKRLVLRESQVEPLVLVFEDLHWVDAETQGFLDSLVESLPAARVLLLVNYRPEYRHGWSGKTYYTQVRLDPLPAESADELLRALLGSDATLAPLKQLLMERTEGNAFFLEESVRTLVETHALAGEPGAYRLAKLLPAIQVPITVHAILAARIDRLPPDEKSLLQSAAVIGKHVPFALLREISGHDDEALRGGLSLLQTAEFLYEVSLFPDLEYTFKHALTHEVAYGSLLHERRRLLHSRIAEAIERLYPDRLAEHVELLAQHALRGEAWDRAARYLRQAGTKAHARSANREAVAYFNQAIEALAHGPGGRERTEQAIDLRFSLRNPLHMLGELEKLLDHLREAEAMASALGDHRRLGRAHSNMSQYLWLTGRNREAIDVAKQALAAAAAVNDPTLEAATNLYLGLAQDALGNFHAAIEALQRTLDILETGENPRAHVPLLIHARTWLGVDLGELGRFQEGFASAREALRLAEASERSFEIVTACFGVGHLHLLKGEADHAIPFFEDALGRVRAGGFRTWLVSIAASLGYAHVLANRLSQGLALLEEVRDTTPSVFRLRLIYLGEACASEGRLDEAARLAERVLARTRERGEQSQQAYALRLAAEVAARRDPPHDKDAARGFSEALALTDEIGMRPLLARCHLGMGRLHSRAGRSSEARAHLTTAATMLRELDMRLWLGEAEAELERVG